MADVDVREGGDITADDMVATQPEPDPSEIQNFYADSVVFVTGATGFLGKLIVEKLLRSCPKVKKIYLLMRPKKGKDVQKRLEEMFDNVLFDRLKREQPNFMSKIEDFGGDCSLPNLGLDDKDRCKLLEEVDTIFHCAATVRFDEKLRTAAYINVRACRDLIRLGKQMKNLRAMIHVSTAYSNCPRKTIEERFYEYKITGEKLLNVIESLDDATLDKITPTLIGEWPNTYVFTKAIAEEVVKSEGEGLPIAVIRPSIVIATAEEPVAGWIDNLYGATGVLVGAAMGVLRSLHADENNLADMVPADYVINNAIAAAWDIAKTKTLNDNKERTSDDSSETEIPIFNYVSTPEKPITWYKYMKLGEKHGPTVPSPLVIWHYFFAMRSNYYWHMFCVLFLHYVPAYIVDFIAICIGKKPMMVKGYEKIGKFTNVISYFSTREWIFSNDNVQGLWRKLNRRDKELFSFSMRNLDWDSYFYTYVRGGRVYLLKDPMDTIPQGRVKYRKLQLAHYALVTAFFVLLFKTLELIVRRMFGF